MSSRITIERILRDDDDASGQTIRQWRIEIEGANIKIDARDGAHFLLMRAEDIGAFRTDLNRAEHLARNYIRDDGPDNVPPDNGDA